MKEKQHKTKGIKVVSTKKSTDTTQQNTDEIRINNEDKDIVEKDNTLSDFDAALKKILDFGK